MPVLELMARDGVYRSQFETGTSNGGSTAHPGGGRWRWESRIFGGTYDDGPAAARPKYGSLNFRGRRTGGSPRFGSAYLRPTQDTLARTTFCYPDSVFEPAHFGVAVRLSTLVDMASADKDLLDDYIEAHVHGWSTSAGTSRRWSSTRVTAAPPSRRRPVRCLPGRMARRLRADHDVATRAPGVPRPGVRRPGVAIAVDGRLEPAIIGDASRTGRYDEQALKRVWHYVARFGNPDQLPLAEVAAVLAMTATMTADCTSWTAFCTAAAAHSPSAFSFARRLAERLSATGTTRWSTPMAFSSAISGLVRWSGAGGAGRTAVSRGTDAEAGTRAIARCGGTAFARDQASSESFGMPGAAISTALVH